eukprot:CAMPEP_0183604514 /NCGR_PEP_ID=MMETSP0371-20130417/181984_1 /TAXON_ID=268820 /ORGANISM="Peridinium aciculiferum, Strain PAER-2" /LENGTH=160 /DNA_ID=CAMNT_0025816611 /DNA_START=280 /DNA_END=759 /DNA_ORIENTATION=+
MSSSDQTRDSKYASAGVTASRPEEPLRTTRDHPAEEGAKPWLRGCNRRSEDVLRSPSRPAIGPSLDLTTTALLSSNCSPGCTKTISGSLPLIADLCIAQPESGKPLQHRFDVVLQAEMEVPTVARLDLRDVVLRPDQRLEVCLCRSHGIAPRGAPPHDTR